MTNKEIKMISEMKKMQNLLDQEIYSAHECKFDLEKTRLALIDELGEMNHENKATWCWWKFTQAPVIREKLLEELVDAWHFALSIDNHTNPGMSLQSEINHYSRYEISFLMSFAITRTDVIIPVMINITHKLGFTIESVFACYKLKNKVNFERLESGY